MADSKHTITINTKATPDTSTPTQTVTPSQVTRPTFDRGERQSMVNTQAHSIRDEQAAQGISIPWKDALRQANEQWRTNVGAANALADTEHESIITSSPEVITDVEAALDGIFDNINEVIENYDPTTSRPDSSMPAKWWEAEMASSSGGDVIDLDGLEDPNVQMGTDDPLGIGDLTGMKPDYGRRAWTGELGAAMEAGVSGSSSSAATAVQATGAMATHPLKAGRDAMAQQLEQSAMGAKVLAAMGTGGEVIPTSDGGGGDGVSDAIGMGEGGDGGGFGDFGGMIGGAIDDIFAGPLKPVDMFIDTIDGAIDKLAAWTSAIEESYEEVMGFSGAMVGARVETELGLLQKRMERADQLGGEFAEFESARGDLLLAFEDLKTVLLKIFMPIIKVGLRVVTKILDIIVWILELLNDIKNWFLDIWIQIMTVLSAVPLIGEYAEAAVTVLKDIKGNTEADEEPTDLDSLGGWIGGVGGHLPAF